MRAENGRKKGGKVGVMVTLHRSVCTVSRAV